MNVTVNWHNLRPWNGSQHTAFEELCCQLASHESLPPGSKWERKGTPDGGIECSWTLPNGQKWGWQCKYFLGSPTEGQWQQLDDSVKTSIEKYPELSIYTVCLPTDRADPKISNKNSFMDKWHKRVKLWETWAADNNMTVEFRYWGESEICTRLSEEKHHGRWKFWFDQEWLSDVWFINSLQTTLRDAGPRYTPELNVELPISRHFEGLGRTKEFGRRLTTCRVKLRSAWRDYAFQQQRSKQAEPCQHLYESIGARVDRILQHLEYSGVHDVLRLDLETLKTLADEFFDIWGDLLELVDELREKEVATQTNQSDASKFTAPNTERESSAGLRHRLSQLGGALKELSQFLNEPGTNAFNSPFVLIRGEAGQGKTHLLCDIAKHRLEQNLPTIVLLGEKFVNAEPWHQILQMLGLDCTPDRFLGALDAAAQVKGGRALIFIDALNEGEGKDLWPKYLAGFLSRIERFPHVGIAVSVRSTYEELVVPEAAREQLISIRHTGFAGQEYQATSAFFEHFGIERPTVPLLHPEWSNPLFLRLFCVGLQKAGLTQPPSGWSGITQIFRFFLDSVNKKLARPEFLDFDATEPVVENAATLVAAEMVLQQRDWLPRVQAQKIVNALLPYRGFHNSLFRHLIAEGILAEENYIREWDAQDRPIWEEGIRIGFERFSDHLRASYLLKQSPSHSHPAEIFAPIGAIGRLFNGQHEIYQRKGLLEALAVQVPEVYGQELPYLFRRFTTHELMQEAFVESLLWRDPSSISDQTRRYINKTVLKGGAGEQLIDVFLTIAPRTDHPYNADFLHKALSKYSLVSRDAWWTIWLHEYYERQGALDRLLDWALSVEDKSHISDESIRLVSVALTWCLTASNRFVRDQATKGLVALLWTRIHLLPSLLGQFEDVDDSYIRERMLAVCYGCCLKSTDNIGIQILAQRIFHQIFELPRKMGIEVWPHLLGRDYARGVVEVALHRGLLPGERTSLIKEIICPPYGSKWPDRFPSEETVKPLLEASPHLRYSLSEWGDFGRYVAKSNLGEYNWSTRRLGQPKPPTLEQRFKTWKKTLTTEQKASFDNFMLAREIRDVFAYQEAQERIATYKRIWQGIESDVSTLSDESIAQETGDAKLNSLVESHELAFLQTLHESGRDIFEREAQPHLRMPNQLDEPFDIKPILYWITQKVFELGWTQKQFGTFDYEVNHYRRDRSAHKVERIGKKYQWIAFHEIAARLADNYYLKDNSQWSNRRAVTIFNGPWEPSTRDIDPSFLLNGTLGESASPSWWAPMHYTSWRAIESDMDWLKSFADLPSVKPMIEVTHPSDGSQWLSLNTMVWPREPSEPSEDEFSGRERSFWFTIQAYLVKKPDADKLWRWACKQNFIGAWMPEPSDLRNVFWGELFWAPSFLDQNNSYHGRGNWIKGRRGGSRNASVIPVPILVTVDEWVQDGGGYDCSMNKTANITIPCSEITRQMGLRPGREGEWLDGSGQMVAFDPSTSEVGPNTLLIKREPFLQFLDKAGYNVFWTWVGVKQVTLGMSPIPYSLEVSGALRLQNGQFEQKHKINFVSDVEILDEANSEAKGA